MNDSQIINLGHILAEFLRGLGMISDNMQRQALGESMAYAYDNFDCIARDIETYAEQLR